METTYSRDVASHGADGQVLVITGTGFLDNAADEHAADTLTPNCRSDDDRFNFSARPMVQQAGQTEHPAVRLSHPRSHPSWLDEVVIESSSRVIPTDGIVAINASVILGQIRP